MKKRILLPLFAGLLLVATATTAAFSYFEFNHKEAEISDIDTHGVNAQFQGSTQTYYRVYFFASPYYATGADGITSTDPVEIADDENNPYNDDTEYLVAGNAIGSTYANATYSGGNSYYFSCDSVDSSKLSTTETGETAIVRYPKKKWSGYIQANDSLNIEETSKYVVMSCANNISSDILSGVIAQSVYKDSWGFGPEFIGWSYKKDLVSSRTMSSSSSRYANSSSDWLVNADGSKASGTAYEIGNYGVQAVLTDAMISSQTSLAYIDSLGLDGSTKGDQVIYLYPVFAAKNGAKYNLINSHYTSFMKLRVNPGSNYASTQSDEIDYSQNRYTVPMQQTAVNNESDLSSTTAKSINYFTEDVYLSCDSTMKIQLDTDPLYSPNGGSWSGNWTTLVSNDDLIDSLDAGYYGFDIAFWQTSSSNTSYCQSTVTNTVTAFEDTNNYVKVIGSKNSSSSTSYGYYYANGYYFCFVIGIKKEHQYRITGDTLNGSINDYDSASDNRVYALNVETTSTNATDSTSSTFYFSKNFFVEAGDEISVLNGSGSTTSTIPYKFSAMDSANITTVNNEMESTQIYLNNNSTEYAAIGDGSPFSVSTDGKKLVVNTSGNYELLFIGTRTNGIATSVGVAYRDANINYSIVILSSKPTQTFFNDLDTLKTDSTFVAFATLSANLATGSATEFTDKDGNATTISDILTDYSKTKLIDTATDEEIPVSLFTNNEFYLYHDFVLYLA